MKKIRSKIISFVFCMVVVLAVLGSCAMSLRVSPEGLRETIESFELLDISVRLVSYSPPMNGISIEIVISDETIPDEYISLLMSAMSEYFRGQQFTDFVNSGIHGIEFDYLGVAVHIFATNRGRIRLIGFGVGDNFAY